MRVLSVPVTSYYVTKVINAHLAHVPTKRGDKGATHPTGTAHHQTQDTETCTFNRSQTTAATKHAASLLSLVIFVQVLLEGRKPLVAQMHRAELKACDTSLYWGAWGVPKPCK
jgi:hypothetical protein